jgi:hypothetical protein
MALACCRRGVVGFAVVAGILWISILSKIVVLEAMAEAARGIDSLVTMSVVVECAQT